MQGKQRHNSFFGAVAEQDIDWQCPGSPAPANFGAVAEQDIDWQCPGSPAPANSSNPLINNKTASCGSRGQQDVRTFRTSQPQVSARGAAADVLAILADAGVSLRVDGDTLKASGRLTDEHRRLIRQHKAELLEQLKAPKNSNDRMRRKVLADLRAYPGITYAAEVDASGDPVIIMLGIRDVGACVLTIDAKRWNLEQFIALLDRQAAQAREAA